MPKVRVEEQIPVPPEVLAAFNLAKPRASVRNPVAEIVLKVYGPRPAHLQPPPEVAAEMERLGIDLEDHPTWGHPDWWTPQRFAHEKALATEYAFKRELHFDDQGWPTVAYLRQWAADEAAFRTTLAAKQAKVVRAVSVGYAHAVARWEQVTGIEEYLFDHWRPTYRESLTYQEGGLEYNLSRCRPSIAAYTGQWFARSGQSAKADERLWQTYRSDPQVGLLRAFCDRWKRPWWVISHEPDGKILVELGYVMKSKKAEMKGQDYCKPLAKGQGYSLVEALRALCWRATKTDERRALKKGMEAVPNPQVRFAV